MEKANQVVVHFVSDSEILMSLEKANSLARILSLPSLEALIQYALVRLKDDLEKAYPPDDETAKLATEKSEYNLVEMLSRVTEENKHDHINISNSLASKVADESEHNLSFYDAHTSQSESLSSNQDESFTIKISLESSEQLHTRWRQEMRAIDNGEIHPATKRLSFETWEDFLDIFSDKGKEMVEMLRYCDSPY
jgi:hypothetical protein